MYTVDDKKNDEYEEEEYEYSTWDNYKGLIFKIIIIILCIIVLIWLIKALKNNRNTVDDEKNHIANVEKVRLAAEDYFFLKNNKEKTSYATLGGLKNAGLIGDVVDANDKVCSESGTKVHLENEVDDYKMTIKMSCSTDTKEETFYYHKNTLACLNCNGKTHMDGKTIVIDDDTKEEEENDEYKYYSCVDWSDWTKVRVTNLDLLEKTKTLVQGVKYGTKTVYGEWSEYSVVPANSTKDMEVETKTITETVWSETKTGTDIDTTNSNIRVISTNGVSEGSSCPGTIIDGTCYSKLKKGNLTFKEYNSGNYLIKNPYCEGVSTLQNKEGLYVLTYLDCEYNEKIGKSSGGYSYTVYTYQELETKEVTYYRYRTITTVNEPDLYTDKKYEEKYLPTGYVKVNGSEETYYSYKLNTCEK